MTTDIMFIAFTALITGLVSLIIGIIARSLRVMLGCVVTSLMIVAGVWLANIIWGIL